MLKSDTFEVKLDPEALRESHPFIPTGSFVADYLIGGQPNSKGVAPCPGLPRGKITQIWGPEASGKTTFALTVASNVCRNGGTVAYIDWENAVTPDMLSQLGIPLDNPEAFALLLPESLEQGCSLIQICAEAGVDLIVLDSVGAAVPQKVLDRDASELLDQRQVGLQARVWSDVLPLFANTYLKKGTALLAISQLRAKIGGMPGMGGPQSDPQGGNAWKYYASLRLEFRRLSDDKIKVVNRITNKTEDRVIGIVTKIKVRKSKVSPSAGREESVHIRFGEGLDDLASILEIAMAYQVLKGGGAGWMNWTSPEGDVIKLQGKEAFRKHFKGHPAHMQALLGQIRPHLSSRSDDYVDTEDEDDIMAETVGMEAES